jgi:hypothetical protein
MNIISVLCIAAGAMVGFRRLNFIVLIPILALIVLRLRRGLTRVFQTFSPASCCRSLAICWVSWVYFA